MIKSSEMMWARHLARMGQKKNAYREDSTWKTKEQMGE
jgi:hypothetical protein